jgi:hypothetical protein
VGFCLVLIAEHGGWKCYRCILADNNSLVQWTNTGKQQWVLPRAFEQKTTPLCDVITVRGIKTEQ